MNVGARVELPGGQDIWVMSNWYGMNKFKEVFNHHKLIFDSADRVPVLFGGDFNAVPHTDGGKSLASEMLLEAGFTDSFRSHYPDVEEYPGVTHRSGNRIDQVYYKGESLRNTSVKVVSDWPATPGMPHHRDHCVGA